MLDAALFIFKLAYFQIFKLPLSFQLTKSNLTTPYTLFAILRS